MESQPVRTSERVVLKMFDSFGRGTIGFLEYVGGIAEIGGESSAICSACNRC
jgi:hypothetical protein